MLQPTPRRRKRLLTGLLAFLIPGAGHIALGRWSKGLLLLSLSVLDLMCMIYYTNGAEVRHLLLVVYLGLALPSLYFYSVYDALQLLSQQTAADKRTRYGKIASSSFWGVILAAIGLFIPVFGHPPEFMRPWLALAGRYGAGIGMLALSIWLLWRLVKGPVRLGRFAAAALILFVAVALLREEWNGSQSILLLDRWWPLIAVLFGLEIVAFGVRYKRVKSLLSIDIIGITASMLIASTAYTVAQMSDISVRWLHQFKQNAADLSGYTEERGQRYIRDPIMASLGGDMERIEIVNPNGQVHIRTSGGDQLRIEPIVWIDLDDKPAADAAAAKVTVSVSAGDTSLLIEGKGEPYGENGALKPRINMIVVLPERLYNDETGLHMSVKTVSGPVNAHDLTLPGGLTVETARGQVNIQRVRGRVDAKTRNGSIKVLDIQGPVNLRTVNGSIKAYNVTGNAALSAVNGAIDASYIDGNLTAITKNGLIFIDEARSGIKADALNGAIEVRSSSVGGAWDVDSAIGDIRLSLPVSSDISVEGSVTFGSISTTLPLSVGDRTIAGKLGKGTHPIRVRANSSIYLEHFQP